MTSLSIPLPWSVHFPCGALTRGGQTLSLQPPQLFTTCPSQLLTLCWWTFLFTFCLFQVYSLLLGAGWWLGVLLG